MKNCIDYSKIAAALDFYQSKGYAYIEVPWIVTHEAMLITSPGGKRFFNTFAGDLVSSGEQSFLQLRETLKAGLYCCATPCFRDERPVDSLHRQYFFKVELIEVNPKEPIDSVLAMIEHAKEFFGEYVKVEVVETDIGKDIFGNGLELGSYGNRFYEGFNWTYGTGCAEPRLSQAIK